MKTVSKREAVKTFATLGDLVHAGETVLVLDAGKPWVKLVPVAKAKRGKSATDFKARLDRICRRPIPGVVEVLQRLRR